jgi:hypothetical protein
LPLIQLRETVAIINQLIGILGTSDQENLLKECFTRLIESLNANPYTSRNWWDDVSNRVGDVTKYLRDLLDHEDRGAFRFSKQNGIFVNLHNTI